MRLLCIGLLFMPAIGGLGGQMAHEPGSSFTVHAEGTTSASYEVYLPSIYRTNQACPLLFAFDAGGSGSAMIAALKPSAEKIGWVVVGCNQLRNGYMPLGNRMADEIFADVRRTLPHDRRREYVGGISGGAMRAYWYTRLFWDEFAGVLAMAGSLGLYDRDYVYPSRLAVAMLNGDHDAGVNRVAPRDTAILERFGVRVHTIVFPGGHQIPPSDRITQAMEWLEEDWKRNGEPLPSMREGEREAQRLIELAEHAARQRSDRAALEACREIVLSDAWTSVARRANELVGELAADPARRAAAFPMRMKFPDSRLREILLARAEGRKGFPSKERIGRWELALAADPRSAQASAGLALALVESGEPVLLDPDRAARLASYATDRTPEWWFAWHVLARVEAAKGDRKDAIVHERRALELAPRPNQEECAEALREYERQWPDHGSVVSPLR